MCSLPAPAAAAVWIKFSFFNLFSSTKAISWPDAFLTWKGTALIRFYRIADTQKISSFHGASVRLGSPNGLTYFFGITIFIDRNNFT
jgi:hypothetical protein